MDEDLSSIEGAARAVVAARSSWRVEVNFILRSTSDSHSVWSVVIPANFSSSKMLGRGIPSL
jgi:hypothetical protein